MTNYPVVYKSFFNFRDLLHPGTVFGVEHENTRTPARKSFLVAEIEEIEETFANNIVESLSALPSCLQKFLQFPRFFAPGYSFWRRTRIHRDPAGKCFFVARCTKKVFNRLAENEIRQNVKTLNGHILAFF